MLSQPATRSGAWVPPRLRSNWDTMGLDPFAVGRTAYPLFWDPFAVGRTAYLLLFSPFAVGRTAYPLFWDPSPRLRSNWDRMGGPIAQAAQQLGYDGGDPSPRLRSNWDTMGLSSP